MTKTSTNLLLRKRLLRNFCANKHLKSRLLYLCFAYTCNFALYKSTEEISVLSGPKILNCVDVFLLQYEHIYWLGWTTRVGARLTTKMQKRVF